jgi:hypothetical protein
MQQKVRLTKVDIVVPNGRPKGEWMEGTLLYPIRAGASVVIQRSTKNGVLNEGIFNTSTVEHVEGELVQTRGSVYRVEKIKEFTPASPTATWKTDFNLTP